MKLLDAVTLIKPCVADGDALVQVLSHILLKDNMVVSYNGMQAMLAKCDEDIEGISCCVPGALFLKLLSSLPDSTMIDHSDHTIRLKNSDTKTSVKLATLNSERFILDMNLLKIKKPENARYILINEKFITGLSKCADTMHDDESRENMYGVTIFVDPDKNTLDMFSTDTHQFSYYSSDTEHTLKEPLLLPKPFCSMLISQKDRVLNNKLYVQPGWVLVRGESLTMMSHLISDVSLLPHQNILEQNYNRRIKTFSIPTNLSEAILRCMLLSSDEKRLTISTTKNVLELIGSSQLGKNVEKIKISNVEFEDSSFIVDGKNLKAMLDQVDEIGFNIRNKRDVVIVGKSESFIRIVSCYSANSEVEEE